MSRIHLPMLGALAVAPRGVTPADPLLDHFARRVRYLRLSVTDRCNYRCTYCMPEQLGSELEHLFETRDALLTFEELTRIATVFARLGVRKLRITGGEPTIRRGIVELVARLAAVPGIEHIAMTTNGHLLNELAAPLREAGLATVNVSVDTLDAAKFHALTGRGELSRVLRGIDAAVAVGLTVKTNAVALRDVNRGEVVALCEDAWRRGATPRFIEHMPMSDGVLYDRGAEVSAAEIRAAIELAHGPLEPTHAARDAGPARYWSVGRDPARRVGIISAMTEHFCGDCNRLRLTAVGQLHACLGHDDAISLRDVLRAGGDDDAIVRAIGAAVSHKREGHVFADAPPAKHMMGIGG